MKKLFAIAAVALLTLSLSSCMFLNSDKSIARFKADGKVSIVDTYNEVVFLDGAKAVLNSNQITDLGILGSAEVDYSYEGTYEGDPTQDGLVTMTFTTKTQTGAEAEDVNLVADLTISGESAKFTWDTAKCTKGAILLMGVDTFSRVK